MTLKFIYPNIFILFILIIENKPESIENIGLKLTDSFGVNAVISLYCYRFPALVVA
jgi:hypothetical protein